MNPTPTVRPALPEDADAFAACHLACWREAFEELWGSEKFDDFDEHRMAIRRRKEIESGIADHFLVEEDGEVVGIAIAGPVPGRRRADRARAVRDLRPGVPSGHRARRRPAAGGASATARPRCGSTGTTPGPARSTSITTSSRTATSAPTPRASWRSGWSGASRRIVRRRQSTDRVDPLACWSGEPSNRQNPRPALPRRRVRLAPGHRRRRGAAGDPDRRTSISTTMRTPGHDIELVHGLLHARGHHRRPGGRHRRPVLRRRGLRRAEHLQRAGCRAHRPGPPRTAVHRAAGLRHQFRLRGLRHVLHRGPATDVTL